MTDFRAAMKKKHSKTGEESRYQGTVLGKEVEVQAVTIVGGPAVSIAEFTQKSLSAPNDDAMALIEVTSPATSGISSAPSTPPGSE